MKSEFVLISQTAECNSFGIMIQTQKISLQTSDNDTLAKMLEANGGEVITAEVFKSDQNGHKFKIGQSVRLIGLVDYPQFNGEIVAITNYREDGRYGKAYYFSTENDALMAQLNWTYEYRLEAVKS